MARHMEPATTPPSRTPSGATPAGAAPIAVGQNAAIPAWLPASAWLYLEHVEGGRAIRELAREKGCHASTVLRRVRRIESRRDDPLIDEALAGLRALICPQPSPPAPATAQAPPPPFPDMRPFAGPADTVPPHPHCPVACPEIRMSIRIRPQFPGPASQDGKAAPPKGLAAQPARRPAPRMVQKPKAKANTQAATVAAGPISAGPTEMALLRDEAQRILRRLCEPGARLAVAPDLDKAAVLKGGLRLAVTERRMAQAFALQDWIAVAQVQGRVSLYEITGPGRAALRRWLAEAPPQGDGDATQPPSPSDPHGDQHRIWAERSLTGPEDSGPRRIRYNLAESPMAVLARRRDKDGTPFLGADLVAAGERLREDFELAQMGPRIAQNWERFLTGADRGGFSADPGPAQGPRQARDRVGAALRDLGPGLGDMVLRVCCFLEGLEQAEQRMGWSARSGKIVLRIALIRLQRHYEETYGGARPLIG